MTDSPMTRAIDAVPSPLLLVLSRALQALSAPVVALLVSSAAELGGEVENAISFCNVLFVGNLCAGIVTSAIFGPRETFSRLLQLDRRHKIEVLVFAGLSALLSALIFQGLENTSVTNTVLLARIGPVLFAMLCAVLLGQSIERAEWGGFSLIVIGVMATVFVGSDFMISKGDVYILASGAVFALVTLLSKRLLPRTGLGALVMSRNLVSAIVFFVIANAFYGPDHFAEAFYGPLWGIMVVYASIVIVAAQLAYYRALHRLTPASIARWAAFTPLIAFVYAVAINGEDPTTTQLVALGFVTAGTVVSNLGRFTPPGTSESGETSVGAA